MHAERDVLILRRERWELLERQPFHCVNWSGVTLRQRVQLRTERELSKRCHPQQHLWQRSTVQGLAHNRLARVPVHSKQAQGPVRNRPVLARNSTLEVPARNTRSICKIAFSKIHLPARGWPSNQPATKQLQPLQKPS